MIDNLEALKARVEEFGKELDKSDVEDLEFRESMAKNHEALKRVVKMLEDLGE